MSNFDSYCDKFRNIAMERSEGILLLRLHTDGGPLIWDFHDGTDVHGALGDAFWEIGRDAENRVVILTGTGADFLNAEASPKGQLMLPDWDRLMKEGRDLINHLLAIEVPVIAAVNGPVMCHPELALLSDIVIATDTAIFGDRMHMTNGIVPGDGMQVLWPMLLGINRARTMMLLDQNFTAKEAFDLGFIAEVLPADNLMPRAMEIARHLLTKPPLALRYTRTLFTQNIKKRMLDELGQGLALEGLALFSVLEALDKNAEVASP